MISIIITSIIILGIISIAGIICYTTYKLSNNKTFEMLHNLIHKQSVKINDIENNQRKYSDNIGYIENISNHINNIIIELQKQLIKE